MAAENVEEKVDVALFYHAHDEEKASTLKNALLGEDLTVNSDEDFRLGGYDIASRASLIENSWCVVLLLTEDFVNDTGTNEFETYTSLHHSIENNQKKVFPVIHCDKSSVPKGLKSITRIDGSRPVDEQAAKILEGVKHLKPPDRSVSSNPLDGPADKMLKFTALKLTHFFAMDAELESLHKDLKGKVDRKCQGANPKQRLKKWENFINEKFDTWKNKRPKKEQHFDCNVSITSRLENLTEDQMLQRLDGQKGYLYLAWLFFASSKMPSDDCTNLAECLDPGNIFELLKRCGVFPLWEDKELEELQKLKDLRNTRAHDATASFPERQQKLIDEIKQKTKESFNKLVMWTFERGISQIVGEAGATANQSNAGEDRHDNVAS